jgi:hypothetical protein
LIAWPPLRCGGTIADKRRMPGPHGQRPPTRVSARLSPSPTRVSPRLSPSPTPVAPRPSPSPTPVAPRPSPSPTFVDRDVSRFLARLMRGARKVWGRFEALPIPQGWRRAHPPISGRPPESDSPLEWSCQRSRSSAAPVSSSRKDAFGHVICRPLRSRSVPHNHAPFFIAFTGIRGRPMRCPAPDFRDLGKLWLICGRNSPRSRNQASTLGGKGYQYGRNDRPIRMFVQNAVFADRIVRRQPGPGSAFHRAAAPCGPKRDLPGLTGRGLP